MSLAILALCRMIIFTAVFAVAFSFCCTAKLANKDKLILMDDASFHALHTTSVSQRRKRRKVRVYCQSQSRGSSCRVSFAAKIKPN